MTIHSMTAPTAEAWALYGPPEPGSTMTPRRVHVWAVIGDCHDHRVVGLVLVGARARELVAAPTIEGFAGYSESRTVRT